MTTADESTHGPSFPGEAALPAGFPNQRQGGDGREVWTAVIAAMPAAVMVTRGPSHIVEAVNAAHRRLFGERDAIGRPAREVWPELESLGHLARMDDALASGRPRSARAWRLARRADDLAPGGYVDVTFQPMGGAGSGAERLLVFAVDVTEQVQARLAAEAAEESARESMRLVRQAADAAPVMIWLAGPDGQLEWCNARWLEFTGRSLHDEQGLGWSEGVHPDDRDEAHSGLRSALAARRSLVRTFRLRHRDGSWRWVLDHATPRTARDGGFRGYVGAAVDVTAQERAASSWRLLARVGGILTDGLAAVDVSGRHPPGMLAEMLQRVADAVVETFAECCVVDLTTGARGDVADHGPLVRRTAMAHRSPERLAALRELTARFPPERARPTLGREAVASGRAQLLAELDEHVLAPLAYSDEHAALARDLGFRSAIIVPLAARGVVFGVMAFLDGTRTFGAEDLTVAEELGRRTAIAIDNARLLDEAERERQNLAAVLAVVPVGIGIADDPEVRNVRVNPAFARQLGIRGDENASKSGPEGAALPFRVLQEGRELPPEELPMQRAARERRTIEDVEIDVVHADGRMVRLLEYAAPLLDASGAVRGTVGAFVDITARVRLQEAERAARTAAEAANRAKSELLRTISHEYRTPLHASLGFLELLQLGLRGPLTAEQSADLERIRANQRHLLALINDVLDLSRIEAGALSFEPRRMSVRALMESLEPLVAPQMATKRLVYAVHLPPPTVLARADEDRARQVLLNLLSNAAKFTSTGGRVELSAEEREECVLVQVRDTGIGIPADRQDDIFEPFVQIGRTVTHLVEGTGLGLTIARHLAELQGGALTVESVPGVGSTFTLRLQRSEGPA